MVRFYIYPHQKYTIFPISKQGILFKSYIILCNKNSIMSKQVELVLFYICPSTNHQSPITNHQLLITNYQSPITNHQSPITLHKNHIHEKTDH